MCVWRNVSNQSQTMWRVIGSSDLGYWWRLSTHGTHINRPALHYTTRWLDDRETVCGSVTERGADYEFRLSAKNLVDYGQTTVQTLRTPDGCEYGTPVLSSLCSSTKHHRRHWVPSSVINLFCVLLFISQSNNISVDLSCFFLPFIRPSITFSSNIAWWYVVNSC